MKILQINPYFLPKTGGSEWYCYNLSKRLVERGHEVSILTSQFTKGQSTQEIVCGVKVYRCPCLGVIANVNPATIILHKLFKMRVDVVHAHSYVFFTSNQAALARNIMKLPLILHLHGGLDFSSLTNDYASYFMSIMKKMFYDPSFGKWTVRRADVVGSVSKRDLITAKELWQLEESKLHWIPNAIDLDDFPRKTSANYRSIIYIGRLEPRKGFQDFLKMAELVSKEIEGVDFFVLGEGSLREYAEAVSKKRCNGRLKILGYVNHERVIDIISQATALVLPSYVEGLPTVCLEALASGTPVIATRLGGIPEVVIEGKTGFLFSPGDVNRCRDRVLLLLREQKLGRNMGKEGRSLVEKSFTWKNVVSNVEGIYQSIVN
jgi:glycosyltransferase involved in cell wall biosynthesis